MQLVEDLEAVIEWYGYEIEKRRTELASYDKSLELAQERLADVRPFGSPYKEVEVTFRSDESESYLKILNYQPIYKKNDAIQIEYMIDDSHLLKGMKETKHSASIRLITEYGVSFSIMECGADNSNSISSCKRGVPATANYYPSKDGSGAMLQLQYFKHSDAYVEYDSIDSHYFRLNMPVVIPLSSTSVG